MDHLTALQRSQLMSRIGGKDTQPELVVRSLLHRMGYRFRLHAKSLPGKPDLVFSSRRKVIFVHGCFWHGHSCKRGQSTPKTNTIFWENKIRTNKLRDANSARRLRKAGWSVHTIWECKIKNGFWLTRAIRFLDSASA